MMSATFWLALWYTLRSCSLLGQTLQPPWHSASYFFLGKWSVINYGLVLLRVQLFPWTLAAAAGTTATASFQAAWNIVGLINPILLGIGNAIPQASAQAYLSGGIAGAVRVARAGYIVYFGLPPILVICAGGLVVPQLLLWLLYGAGSPYLDATLSVQLLVVAGVIEYVAETISKTLLGIQQGSLVFKVNVVGIAAAVVTLPLIIPLGVVGACLALAIAYLVRLITVTIAIRWLIAMEKKS